MVRLTSSLLLLWGAAWASAQSGGGIIPWQSEPQRAIQMARSANRPLLVYVVPPVRERVKEGSDKLENRQERAFKDLAVLKQARNFVPLKLMRGTYREANREFGFSEAAGYEIRFVTPDGHALGAVPSSDVAVAETLAKRIAAAWEEFIRNVYQTQVKPILDKKDATSAELKSALKLVSDFRIVAAEKDVIELLDRERLDAGTRTSIDETLATLSTKDAVAKLLDRARAGDASATKALDKMTPEGAVLLLPELNPGADKFDYFVYRVVTKVAGVKNVKPEKYFQASEAVHKAEEVQRVSDAVKAAAEKWKAQND
jgi:hypothetical protein